ncbi:unnamed protein product [Pylaiella littoralis]
MGLSMLNICDDKVCLESSLARRTMHRDVQGRLTFALAAAATAPKPPKSTTELVDDALSQCMEQFMFLGERTPDEEEAIFSDKLAARTDLIRAMTALEEDAKWRRTKEVRSVLADVKRAKRAARMGPLVPEEELESWGVVDLVMDTCLANSAAIG